MKAHLRTIGDVALSLLIGTIAVTIITTILIAGCLGLVALVDFVGGLYALFIYISITLFLVALVVFAWGVGEYIRHPE